MDFQLSLSGPWLFNFLLRKSSLVGWDVFSMSYFSGSIRLQASSVQLGFNRYVYLFSTHLLSQQA